jgi:hypothetical protein
VSADDQRIAEAREFLADKFAGEDLAALPLDEVTARELAESYRHLSQLLGLLGDYADEERLRDATYVDVDGGARISPAGMLVLAQALPDAVAWRDPADLDEPGDEAAGDEARTRAYRALARELSIEIPGGNR